MNFLLKALSAIRANSQFSVPSIDNPTLSDVIWHDDTPRPTQEEFDAAIMQAREDAGKDAIQAQIDQLERDSLMNRGSREMSMRLIEQQAAINATNGATAEQILDEQPFYVKLKALDDQIAALRGQL